MPTIAEVRQQYPQYQDMSDQQLADALYKKFYSDMPREQFDAKVGMTKPAEAGRGLFTRIDDAVRGAADMLTFGFADEISAGLGAATGVGGDFGDYGGNVAAQRERDKTGGWERFGGQVAGALALPASRIRSVGEAVMKGGAAGAAYGFGAGEGSAVERLPSAGVGALTGGAAGGVLKVGANALGNRAAAKAIPSNEQLRASAKAAFDRADKAGVIIKPSGMQRLQASLVDDMAEFGYDPALQPGAAAIVNTVNRLSGQNTTLKGVDLVRRIAQQAGRDRNNPSQQELSRRIIDKIDDFMETLPADDIVSGNAAAGLTALKEARGLWGQLRRSEMVDSAAYKAELRAASTGSGGNVDNATRQNVRRLVENPRGMSHAERKAAETVVRGTTAQNALRQVGKLAPTGVVSGGIGSSMGAAAGAALGGPAGAAVGTFAVPAVGQIAKTVADRMTVKNVERLSQMIRSNGKTAKELANLARGGRMDIGQVRQIEAVAKSLGVSVPTLAAAVREKMATGG